MIEVRPTSRLEYNFRWPGHPFDPVTRLHYDRCRAYDLVPGRFLQSNPVGYAGSEYSLYGSPSNPLSVVDVLGLACRATNQPRGNGDADRDGTRRWSRNELPPPRHSTVR